MKNSATHPVDDKRKLYFLSDFPHLVKNLRNTFISKGYLTTSGYVHSGIIQAAFDADRDNITLKVMPRITDAHLKPNQFEKMKVDLAFQLFGDEVIKGIFLHRQHIESTYKAVQPTEDFIKLINRLIRVMTARISYKALKADSPDTRFLESFLEYIDRWKESAKPSGGGFLTDSTATGLRVTIQSTLDLLSYLHSECGFKYLPTSRLSQDKLENLFGIIRQS